MNRSSLTKATVFLLSLLVAAPSATSTAGGGEKTAPGTLSLGLRKLVETKEGSGRFHTVVQPARWEARKTAIIVCDMWDLHHCLNATRRVGEMAPRMNQVLTEARNRGVLIIHAPSSCMAAYKDHPARQNALKSPRARTMPKDIASWCNRIPAEEKGVYPIDQTDGGEDDDLAEHRDWARKLEGMGRNPRAPWKSEVDLLKIDPGDVISDSGEEIWSVLEHRGIDNVILLGVHTNMCVLGRPFGLRQMAKNGKNVVLMRDLTDTMYNPARAPFVSHFTGTDLIVEHIEKWVCPTITSDQVLGGKPFCFAGDRRPHLVMVMAESEYQTNRTLPEFARKHLGKDFRVSCVHGSETNSNDLPGLEVLNEADLALISVRRRALPKAQMEILRRFVASGKPVIGIRTASHAFSLNGKKPPEGCATWEEFDHEVLGGNYKGHYGTGPKVMVKAAEGAAGHPILDGVPLAELQGQGSLYKVSPLARGATPLLLGSIPDRPVEPLLWVHATKSGGRVVYTSLGHPDDFKQSAFNLLLRNVVCWTAGLPAEPPSPSGFTPLFNGKDLTGWHGMPHFDPYKLAAMSEANRKTQIEKWTDDAKKHWTVENGELVNDGKGAYLTTDKEYGDIELLIDYKTVPKADSGIYLRSTPQVQIWDYTKEGGKWDRGADKGSGGLWNNSPGAPGKDPLVLADKPFGEWNSFRILQVGERVTVFLNGKLVVDHARLENFWNRKLPLLKKAPIQLQTHGGEIRWRNLFVREIPAAEANTILRHHGVAGTGSKPGAEGFVDVFNGKDFTAWAGPVDQYEVQDGAIVCRPRKGGTIYTKDEYGDFIVRLEFKLPPAGNNGLAIRYPGHGDTAYVGMCELQVLDDSARQYARLDPRQYHGSAYGMVPAHRGYQRPVGEWNYQEATIKGSTIKVELNGTVILDTDLSKVTEYMGKRPHPGKERTSGHFGFAGHNDPVAFRNIQIKRLDAK
jgi:nicotinamidase-related amidase